jgi:hypothetical protein
MRKKADTSKGGSPPVVRDEKGRWLKGHSANPAMRFTPGVSGNPGGLHRLRREFEAAFTEALYTGGNPADAVKPLWDAVRKGEPWAQQLFWSRLCPQSLRLEMDTNNEKDIDLSKLSDADLEQLRAILDAARPENTIDGRALPAVPEGVPPGGLADH